MAVVYESDGATVWCAANNNNAVTVPLPAIRPVGSVLLFVAWCRLITAAAPSPAGYSLLATWTSGTVAGGRMWLYAKEVVGDETAPSVIPAGATGTTGDVWGAEIVCYSGVDLSGGIANILDGTPTLTDTSGTTTNTYPALTIAQDDSMIIRFLCRFRDAIETFTPTATWNEREDAATTNRTGGQHHWQDKLATASGAQAAVTVVPSAVNSGRYLAVTAALKAIQLQTHFGSLSLPIIFDAAVAGDVVIPAQTHYGSLAMPLSFESEIVGRRKTFGQLALPITFSKNIQGQRKTFGQIQSSFVFGKSVAGRKTTFGQLGFPIVVAIQTAGFRVGLTHYGAISLPITFGKDIRGRRKTFGQISLPLVFTKQIQGQRKTFGQLALPIIFSKSVSGRKQVFGQISSSFLFGASLQGRRRAFGKLDLPIGFVVNVKTGRVGAHGRIAFPIIVGFETFGSIRTDGVILNQAKMIYLGSELAEAVYAGGVLVWPVIPVPLLIAGLGIWLNASELELVDGAQVTSWTDLSGNNRHLLPNAQGTNPIYKTNGLNGLPIVRFNGTSNILSTSVVGVTYHHFFVVAKFDLTTFPSYNGLITGPGGNELLLLGEAGGPRFYPPLAGGPGGSAQDFTLWKNGALNPDRLGPMGVWESIGLASPTGWPNLQIQIGLDRVYSPRWWDGGVAEVIAYDRVLSTAERQQVETYLRDKWSLV